MESAYAEDFSSVRVHLGRAKALRPISAEAATVGEEIAFASTAPRQLVVAHELAHVIQARSARNLRAGTLPSISQPGSNAELEADRAAARAAQGARVQVTGAPGGTLQPFFATTLSASIDQVLPLLDDPIGLLSQMRGLLDAPVIGSHLRERVATQLSEGAVALLDLDAETMAEVARILADPEGAMREAAARIQPTIEQIPGQVREALQGAITHPEIASKLALLRGQTLFFERLENTVGTQLNHLGANWQSVFVEALKAQFLVWDWKSQIKKELGAIQEKLKKGTIDSSEALNDVVQVWVGLLDRILGLIGIAMFLTGLIGGTAAGAAAIGAVAGFFSFGTGAAPGGTAGGGGGAGIGGGAGAIVYQALGSISNVLDVGGEIVRLSRALSDIQLNAEQTKEQVDEDYSRAASAIIALALTAGLWWLGSIAGLFAKRVRSMLGLVPVPPPKQLGRAAPPMPGAREPRRMAPREADDFRVIAERPDGTQLGVRVKLPAAPTAPPREVRDVIDAEPVTPQQSLLKKTPVADEPRTAPTARQSSPSPTPQRQRAPEAAPADAPGPKPVKERTLSPNDEIVRDIFAPTRPKQDLILRPRESKKAELPPREVTIPTPVQDSPILLPGPVLHPDAVQLLGKRAETLTKADMPQGYAKPYAKDGTWIIRRKTVTDDLPQLEVDDKGLIRPATKKKSKKRKRTDNPKFRRWVLAKILADNNHPLRFLIDATGKKFRNTSLTKRGVEHLTDIGWEVGHQRTLHSLGGRKERLAVQDPEGNARAGVLESGGSFFEFAAVDIGGVPVEVETALSWERMGLFDPPLDPPVRQRPRIDGWEAPNP